MLARPAPLGVRGPGRTEGTAGFGIEGYAPQWQYSGRVLAAAHRARFRSLIGQPLHDAWLMWDLDTDRWFADGPVILGFTDANVEITHRKFDECAITWDQVDMLLPLHWAATPTASLAPLDHSDAATPTASLAPLDRSDAATPPAPPAPVGHSDGEIKLDWQAGGHPALATVRGRRLREVNVIERLMTARWRPTVLHAVELIFQGPVRLAIFNALDENGLTDRGEVDLPVGRWRRVPIA